MTDDIATVLRKLEEQLLDPAVRASRERVAALIADDFIEFGTSGRTYNKSEVVESLARENFAPGVMRTAREFHVRALSDCAALVTYEAAHSVEIGVVSRSLRSSVWILADDRWQMLLHQGTPAAAL